MKISTFALDYNKELVETIKGVTTLAEAKMSDKEVLAAAKQLAKNGKDKKTKEFGQGLVDFYAKNKSFTPEQVGGLQNIMKNAGFQFAKEESVEPETEDTELDEARVGKRIQIAVPETDSAKARKYFKDAEMDVDVGTQGNKAVFDIQIIDQEDYEQIADDLRSLKVRHKLVKEETENLGEALSDKQHDNLQKILYIILMDRKRQMTDDEIEQTNKEFGFDMSYKELATTKAFAEKRGYITKNGSVWEIAPRGQKFIDAMEEGVEFDFEETIIDEAFIRDTSAKGILWAKNKSPYGTVAYFAVNPKDGDFWAQSANGTSLATSNFMYMLPPRRSTDTGPKYKEQLANLIQKEVVRGKKSLHKVLSDFTKIKWEPASASEIKRR